MLACTETITVMQLEYDSMADKDVRRAFIIHGVSWFGKLVVGMEGKGLVGKSEYRVRIPANVTLPTPIHTNDIIVRGAVSTYENNNEIEKMEHFTVLSVGDNRRGRHPHWAVRGV